MSRVLSESRVETLAERLMRGADLLFDMEQRGETGDEYRRWLERWMQLLAEYEAQSAA